MVKKISHRNIKKTFRDRVRRGVVSSLTEQERFLQNQAQQVEQFPVAFTNESDESGSAKLHVWAVKHNITRNALTELLKILISFGLTWLPSDSRTLLQTPTSTQLVNVANGQLWYSGIEINLRRIFSETKTSLELMLNFNIDGLPIFDSTKNEFWPILANFHSMHERL